MNLRRRVWWRSGEERREMCLEATRDIVVGVVGRGGGSLRGAAADLR